MKRFLSLIFVAVLLSGCPEAKLPTPTPMVPAPKAAGSATLDLYGSQLKGKLAEPKDGAGHA